MAAHRSGFEPGLQTAAAHLDHVREGPYLALDAVQAHQRVQFAENGARRTHRLGGHVDDGGGDRTLRGYRTEHPGGRLGRRQHRGRRGRGSAQPALVAGAVLHDRAHP